MANNCLVTKLKGVVNNNNLPIYGSLRFKILYRDQIFFQGIEKIFIEGGGHFCSTSEYNDNIGKELLPDQHQTIRAYITPDVEGVSCDLIIKDSYGLYKISSVNNITPILTGDFSQFNYRNPYNLWVSTDLNSYGDLDSLNISSIGLPESFVYGLVIMNNSSGSGRNNIKFNIEKFAGVTNPSLKNIQLNRSKAYGNISALAGNNWTKIDLDQTDVSGDISTIGNCTNLDFLSLYGCPSIYGNIESLYKLINTTRILLSGTPVTGTIETLAEGMLAQGKTTEVQITSQDSTFHGVSLGGARVSLNFGSGTITVRQYSTGSVLGTYSNGTWTYNS